jgi:hypothetical protein
VDSDGSLLYMYGIVPAGAPIPPPELRGLEDGPVRLLEVGAVAAIVSEVPAGDYEDDALNARLEDLEWIGERGLAHERVLDWFIGRAPVLPLSLFSLHRDERRATERIEGESESFVRILRRLAGGKEWGIKLWRRDAEASAGIDEHSPSLQALGRTIDAAPPGKRFLLEKKREAMRAEELRAASKRVAHEAFSELSEVAQAAVSAPLPPASPEGKALLLHAAFLVSDDDFESFQRVAGDLAGRYSRAGFEIELTGPWPPYHFTTDEDD